MGGAIVCEGIDDAGNPVNPVFDFALSVRGARTRDEFERVWSELDAAREAAEYAARVLNAYKV